MKIDIQKEREAFESWWESFHNGRQIACDYVEEDNSYSVGYANAQWVAWQAKAQAVPEVKPSHTVTLTCAQLLEAFRFGAPDEDDPEQLKTEMTITWSDVGHSGKGYYCYYSELPEEGAIFLDEEGDAQEST